MRLLCRSKSFANGARTNRVAVHLRCGERDAPTSCAGDAVAVGPVGIERDAVVRLRQIVAGDTNLEAVEQPHRVGRVRRRVGEADG